MSIKIALIGAGSVVFSKNLTGDILGYPEFRDATFTYMDIDQERLEVGANLCRKVAKAVGANPTIEATMDRRKALDGADFVINMVQIGGFDSTLVDFEIPRKYGLNFTIADTTGPGGLFRALRTYPMLSGLCKDMEDLCPKATLLNYSNPMCMNMQTIFRTSSIDAVGLCHSVQGTIHGLMHDIGENVDDIAFICAGINHMAFYLKIEKGGVDLYPRIFEAAENSAIFGTNKVRYELMKRLGYFVTESSEHNAEYCPYFIPHGEKMIAQFAVPIDEYLRRCDGIVDEFERMKDFSVSEEPIIVHRSQEYGSTIIHSLVTGKPSVVYGNRPNRNSISNLPSDAIVEVATLVDRAGLQPTTVGALPPQLIGYMQPHVTQQELFIRAAMEGRRDHVYQACMFDPLTAATMPLDKIVDMCDELIAAHGDFLPKLEKKSLVAASGKTFGAVNPKDLRAQWDSVQKEKFEGTIADWHIIGPFTGDKADRISLDDLTAVDAALGADGAVDLTATYEVDGRKVSWQSLHTRDKGYISLDTKYGKLPNALAYAYTEIESVHAREAVLRCGSDDGIRIWINGEVVHSNEIQRGHTLGADSAPIYLKAGTNRIFVKVDNYANGWGFSVIIPKPNF